MNYPYIIEELKKKGSVPGLDSIRRLLDELGRPEQRLHIVHIAGTNGKGSVFAFLSSILQEGGYLVGRYISPTIQCYEERFQINGQFIKKEELEKYYTLIGEAIGRMKEKGYESPTLFEAETALAFLHFADRRVDFALIETGMGGTLDATNVIEKPVLTVIASISYDHQAFLGDTLEEIAAQKAGIIKEKVPVILSPNPKEVRQVICKKADKQQADLIEINKEDYRIVEETPEGSRFLWKGMEFFTCLPGEHQVANAVTALAAAKQLISGLARKNKLGKQPLSSFEEKNLWKEEIPYEYADIMLSGIRKTRWPGRLELLKKRPYFYRDGAHNPDGAGKLAAFVEKHFTNKKIIYIMGVLKDKDYKEMLRVLMPHAGIVFVFRPDNERGLAAELLEEAIWDLDAIFHWEVKTVLCQDVNEAIHRALAKAGEEDVIVACGSLSFMEDMEVLS